MATLPANNNASGGSNGTTVTALVGGNSGGASGTFWDNVNIGGTGTATFDNTHTIGSSPLAYKLVTSASASTFLEWDQTMSASTSYWGRTYFYGGNSQGLFRLVYFPNGGNSRGQIQVDATGHLLILDRTNATQQTFTNAINNNAWCRIEWKFIANATTGLIEVQLFNSPNSGTATETKTASNINTDTSTPSGATGVSMGILNNPGAVHTVWLNYLNVNATAYPGPISAAPNLLFVS